MTQYLFSFIRTLVILILFFTLIYFPASVVFDFFSESLKYESCVKTVSVGERQRCYKELISHSVKKGNYLHAIDLVKQILKSDNLNCHSLAHELGRDFYDGRSQDNFMRINDPMSMCAYGFWHGFMGRAAADENVGIKTNVDFKKVCTNMLGNKISLYNECYHGFGLGFVGDPPRYNLWGDVDRTVAEASKKCREVTDNNDVLDYCYTGVFHQILNYMQEGAYEYKLPSSDKIISFCSGFGGVYVKPCLRQLSPMLYFLTGYDLPKLFSVVRTEYGNLETEQLSQMIFSMVGGRVNQITDEEIATDLRFCYTNEGLFKENCVRGVIGGLLTKTKEGDVAAFQKMISFCETSGLNEENVSSCFVEVGGKAKIYLNFNKEVANFCKSQPKVRC